MNNVHPLFHNALAPFVPAAPRHTGVLLRPFAVSIRASGRPATLNVLAYTACDAICHAIDAYFDGDDAMPADGLEIEATPTPNLPRAA